MAQKDPRIELVKQNIEAYVDFPKAGIVFQDIFGAMRKTQVLTALMELTKDHAKSLQGQIDCVVGLDSRGFLFGPIMAVELQVPFVPIRKKGKLPGDCLQASYDLEYGSASIELQKNAFEFCKTPQQSCEKVRVLVVDDLLATGGTLKAACDLVNATDNARVTSAFVVMELEFLKGSEKLNKEISLESMIKYN